jgi:hypothetical protein
MDQHAELLRHTLAVLAYRASRALEDASEDFSAFDGAGRQPVQILAHMGDLLDWALSMANGSPQWCNSKPFAWKQETERFFTALGAFDARIASGEPLHAPIERLLQGPVADALTHVGQLALLRRLAGCPIRGENYYVASIASGQIGPTQPAPVRPFK